MEVKNGLFQCKFYFYLDVKKLWIIVNTVVPLKFQNGKLLFSIIVKRLVSKPQEIMKNN